MKQKIEVVKADITTLQVDAIVNAANGTLLGGGGVDGAIHRAAGERLLEYCRTLNGCPTGEVRITPGFNLKARYVIHTVGPVYFSAGGNRAELLAACYRNSMELAAENGIGSIAFPCISTGVYGYPHEEAAAIAIREVQRSLMVHPKVRHVVFCCYLDVDYDLYTRLL